MGATSPSSIHVAKPLVSQSCAWRDPGPHGLRHLWVTRGAQPHLALEQQEAAGLDARVRHHVGGHGPQAVLDGGCQFELGGDDGQQ